MNRETVTTTLRWLGDWPWYSGLLAASALALTAWLLYRRESHNMRPLFRLLLPVLRAAAVFLIVILLAGPVLHYRKVIGELARLIILLDGSESMQLADPGMDAGRKIQILERLGMLDPGTVNLDQPQAAAALTEAKNLADGVKSSDPPTADAWKAIRNDFAALINKADGLFAKSSKVAEQLASFRTELAAPAAELAAREMKSVDDRTRAADDLAKLATAAGRWSAEIAGLFQQAVNAEGANPAVKNALDKFDSLPRWQRVRGLLLDGKPEQRLLAKLAAKFDLQVVALDNNEVKPVWQAKSGDNLLPESLPKPAGSVTNLTNGLVFSVSREQKSGQGAVILITDGQQNAGDSPLETAKILAAKKMPVYTLGTGSHIAPLDLAVVRCVVPDSVFHEDVVRGEIMLKEEAPANLPITVRVQDGEKTVWEKQLVTEAKSRVAVPFDFPVKELTEARIKVLPQGVEAISVPIELKVSVTPLDGERELSNNECNMRFRSLTHKRRILLIDGRPRWESRYLRNLYQRDEKWEVNAAIAGMRADAGFLRGDKEGCFPAEKAMLDAYDLIIFGEVPKSLLKPEEIRWIADFVDKRGGAIIFIDGSRGYLKDYADTPIGQMLPVDYTDAKPPVGLKSYLLAGRAGELAPYALSDEMAANAEVWAKLPVPKSVIGVKPLAGAEVLVEGETANGRVPLAILRPYGAGKVYYHAFDDSWRWRYEVADKFHVKFWNQIANYIAEEPFAARDPHVSLDAGKLTYEPGEQAAIRVRLRSGEGKPVIDATVNAVLSRDGKPVATISLTPDQSGLYRGKSAALELGNYEVAVESAVVPEGQLKVRTGFRVEARQKIERTLLSVNEDLLRQISLTSGGRYFREEQVDQLLKMLEPMTAGNILESETPLLESKWWFGLLVLLLTTEWLIRKRIGML